MILFVHFFQQEIAVPLQVCVKWMIEMGVWEEGLMRVAGSSTRIKRLRGLFDAGFLRPDSAPSPAYDIHVVAGAFKVWILRRFL